MKDLKDTLLEGEEDKLALAQAEAQQLADLRQQGGYNAIKQIMSMFYAKVAECNMEEGGVNTERWIGVRIGMEMFFNLVGEAEDTLKKLDAAMVEIEKHREDDVAPGADFMPRVGESAF